ncbi:MAG: potassium-transporting ATPase subunit C [Candidatus Dormibacteria bacterium]|jgi:K+-transporting ATPase ATPase C chain
MRKLLTELNTALRITVLIAVLCGIAYPLVMTGAAQIAFNSNANGSLVSDSKGHVIGSSLIGQCYYKTTTDTSGTVTYQTTKDDQGNAIFVIDPRYFQSRPSFTVDANGKPLPCNAANSVGSNLAPSSKVLLSRVEGYTDYLHSLGIAKNPDGSNAPMPVDLVTGDFTGFDPDISDAAALAQVSMVAAARHLDSAKLQQLVESHVAGRPLGIFGSPHVTVLSLNMALDAGAAS